MRMDKRGGRFEKSTDRAYPTVERTKAETGSHPGGREPVEIPNDTISCGKCFALIRAGQHGGHLRPGSITRCE